ncbi:unnamed protein product [Oikopleura dioica]|uniref:Cyclin-like domain-containing protein n=1 Tax=Oikopleura dioica TaxID=34765 RepID=E4XHY1_OIKDI|nr:unnamed protein product [Oikopleura dioica]
MLLAQSKTQFLFYSRFIFMIIRLSKLWTLNISAESCFLPLPNKTEKSLRISMARSNKDSVPLRRLALNLKAIVAKQKEEWKTCESNVNAASESSDSDFVSIEDRENTCRWLLDVAESLKMSPDTVALCFCVFDRVLNVLKVRTRLVRVLAAACLSLTAKYTEDEARESFARSLCTAAGFTFSRKDLLRMELLVCTKLDWQLGCKPTTPLCRFL